MGRTIRLQCRECGKKFDKPKGEYNRWIRKGRDYFFCSYSCASKHSNCSKAIPMTVKKCPHCGKEFETKIRGKRSRKYCSRKCAGTHSAARQHNSIETRRKLSKSISRKWKDPEYATKCSRSQARAQYFTSTGERELREFFQTTYPSQNWTYGGRLIVDGFSISRDLYSDTLKVCIEYDGIWHFIDIKGQLEDKQAKDAALLKWCGENSYRLIRIEDEIYKEDPSFWQKRIAYEVEMGDQDYTIFYRPKHTKH